MNQVGREPVLTIGFNRRELVTLTKAVLVEW